MFRKSPLNFTQAHFHIYMRILFFLRMYIRRLLLYFHVPLSGNIYENNVGGFAGYSHVNLYVVDLRTYCHVLVTRSGGFELVTYVPNTYKS
jgi:hypothetical protein